MSRDTPGPNQFVQAENCGSSYMPPMQPRRGINNPCTMELRAKKVGHKSSVSTYWPQQDDNCMLNWFSRNSTNMEDKPFELGLIIMWSI